MEKYEPAVMEVIEIKSVIATNGNGDSPLETPEMEIDTNAIPTSNI